MKNNSLLPLERIESKIYLIRGKKVMFDRDLAELYGVETKVFNQAVRRNQDRFPEDFMFKLNQKEIAIWESNLRSQSVILSSRSQIVTLNASRFQFGTLKRGQNIKYAPMVFTEQGVAMLSSVLNSKRAIQVNIQIMRTFTKLREMLATNKELREKIEKLERKYNQKFRVVFEVIAKLLTPSEENPKGSMGFRI